MRPCSFGVLGVRVVQVPAEDTETEPLLHEIECAIVQLIDSYRHVASAGTIFRGGITPVWHYGSARPGGRGGTGGIHNQDEVSPNVLGLANGGVIGVGSSTIEHRVSDNDIAALCVGVANSPRVAWSRTFHDGFSRGWRGATGRGGLGARCLPIELL